MRPHLRAAAKMAQPELETRHMAWVQFLIVELISDVVGRDYDVATYRVMC